MKILCNNFLFKGVASLFNVQVFHFKFIFFKNIIIGEHSLLKN